MPSYLDSSLPTPPERMHPTSRWSSMQLTYFIASCPYRKLNLTSSLSRIGRCFCGMRDLVRLIVWMVADLFRSRAVLEAEILTLRQQINVLRRTAPKKQTFSSIDRLIFVCLYRLPPGVRGALAIVKPATVVK